MYAQFDRTIVIVIITITITPGASATKTTHNRNKHFQLVYRLPKLNCYILQDDSFVATSRLARRPPSTPRRKVARTLLK